MARHLHRGMHRKGDAPLNTHNRTIYLVCSKTGTWLSTLITLFSRIQYPHASISFDESFERMYTFGRTRPCNPVSGGFAIENLNEGVYKNHSDCSCAIYRIAVTQQQYEASRRLVEEFIRNKGMYRYSLLGLVGVLFNIPIKRSDHYFCSQFVAEVLIKSEVVSSSKVPQLITTDDLRALVKNYLVYEGVVEPSLISQAMNHAKVS